MIKDTSNNTFEMVTVVIVLGLVIVAVVGSVAYYHTKDRQLMSNNIETAILKGIDPLAVRCSYADKNDTVCVAYSASHGTQTFSSMPPKK
jgi:hypothetical protein